MDKMLLKLLMWHVRRTYPMAKTIKQSNPPIADKYGVGFYIEGNARFYVHGYLSELKAWWAASKVIRSRIGGSYRVKYNRFVFQTERELGEV